MLTFANATVSGEIAVWGRVSDATVASGLMGGAVKG